MKNLRISKGRSLIYLCFILAIAGLSDGCSKSSNSDTNPTGPTQPGANEVWIQDMAFNPSSITVTAGTTVKWTNKDAVTHNVTSTTQVFSSGDMGNGATFTFQFNTAGTFPYTCTIHPTMTGTVIVN